MPFWLPKLPSGFLVSDTLKHVSTLLGRPLLAAGWLAAQAPVTSPPHGAVKAPPTPVLPAVCVGEPPVAVAGLVPPAGPIDDLVVSPQARQLKRHSQQVRRNISSSSSPTLHPTREIACTFSLADRNRVERPHRARSGVWPRPHESASLLSVVRRRVGRRWLFQLRAGRGSAWASWGWRCGRHGGRAQCVGWATKRRLGRRSFERRRGWRRCREW